MAKTVKLNTIISADARRFNQTMHRVRQTVRNVAVALSGAGFTAAAFSVKEAVAFEKQLGEVNTIANVSASRLRQLKKEVLALGAELGATTEELTGGLYQALSAGVPTDNGISFLRTATKAAIAGVTDTKTAVDGLTTVLNAYGLSASEAESVSDKLFTAVKLGKTTFPELAGSIGTVATIAKSSGVSIDELFSSIVQLTKVGVKTDEAITGIRATLTKLSSPTDDMKEAFKKMGIESGTASIRSIGLQRTLQGLFEAVGKNEEKFKSAFGNVRAFTTILKLTGSDAASFQEIMQSMGQSTGATSTAFTIMAATTAQSMARIRGEIQKTAITIGDELIPSIEPVATAFSQALGDPETIENIKAIIAATASLSNAIGFLIGRLYDLGEAYAGISPPIFALIKAVEFFGSTRDKIGIDQAFTPEQVNAARLERFFKQGVDKSMISTNQLKDVAENFNLGRAGRRLDADEIAAAGSPAEKAVLARRRRNAAAVNAPAALATPDRSLTLGQQAFKTALPTTANALFGIPSTSPQSQFGFRDNSAELMTKLLQKIQENTAALRGINKAPLTQ